MTTRYVDSNATGSNNGSSWANAWASLETALEYASGADGDIILVAHNHSESQAGPQTITAAKSYNVLCVNTGTGALETTGQVKTTSDSIVLSGGQKKIYIYGIKFWAGNNLLINDAGTSHYELESCSLRQGSVYLYIGGNDMSAFTKLTSCVLYFSGTTSKIQVGSRVELVGCSIDPAGYAPTTLFANAGLYASNCKMIGCDLSKVTGTLFPGNNANGGHTFTLSNCRLGSGVTIHAAWTTTLHRGNLDITMFNCDSGATFYQFYHANPLGSTTIETTIYANDGASYDRSGNRYSWSVQTTADCSYWTPYVSPWLSVYHDGTAAITPSVECVRSSASAAAFKNDEVWSEWSYQGNASYPLATIVSDRMTPLGSNADQTTGALSGSGWEGENATSWFGKLAPTSAITPAEIGDLKVRIVVGKASVTDLYVDPQIRGRT